MTSATPLTRWPAHQIADGVRSGAIAASEVVDAHLDVIASENPTLNALTVTFVDRARRLAAEIDRSMAQGADPGPFAGVPISVKENIDLTWSATTNGWRGHADAIPVRDATVVQRMRDAGAIPIGRGNMPDFGMRWDTDNDLFGRTLNPWDHDRSVGGSSGGDAVAVSTGMSAIGLGNDFGGSLRIPAYAVGIAGLRPSRGSVPRAAVRGMPVALTLQQFAVNGALARTVDDLELAFTTLRGGDVDDPMSLNAPRIRAEDLPRRVGVTRDPAGWGVDPVVAAGIDRAAAALASAGWDVVDIEPPRVADAAVIWRRLACTDMLFSLDPAQLSQPLGSSATRFLRDSTAAAAPYETAREYAEAWAEVSVIAADWRRLQTEVPVILGPVMTSRMGALDYDLGVAPGAQGREAATAAWRDLRLTVAVNLLGLPALALPTGTGTDGMPTGMQVIGSSFGEEIVFAAARAVETGIRRADG